MDGILCSRRANTKRNIEDGVSPLSSFVHYDTRTGDTIRETNRFPISCVHRTPRNRVADVRSIAMYVNTLNLHGKTADRGVFLDEDEDGRLPIVRKSREKLL